MEIEHIRNKKNIYSLGMGSDNKSVSYYNDTPILATQDGWVGFFFESELICKYNIKDVKKLVLSLTLPKAVCRISECLVIWE